MVGQEAVKADLSLHALDRWRSGDRCCPATGSSAGRRAAWQRWVVPRLLWGALLVFGGCAASPYSMDAWVDRGAEVVWPQPPEPARIAYLGTIGSGADLGRRVGLGKWLMKAVFGDDPSSMVRPAAVAKNKTGILVVADPGIPTVHFVDLRSGEYSRLPARLASRLASPVGVAIDDAGRVYVADSLRAKIFVFDGDRRLIAEWGEGILSRPTGIALDPASDRVYVVDTVEDKVVVFDVAGQRLADFGRRGVGRGEFNAPTHVTATADGKVIVSDSLNFRVQTFTREGKPLSSFGRPGHAAGNLARPKGVAVDSSGRYYVVDAAFDNVQIFDPGGRLLLAFGGPGSGPGGMALPAGLCVDSNDRIWVADSYNRRIQVFELLRGDD